MLGKVILNPNIGCRQAGLIRLIRRRFNSLSPLDTGLSPERHPPSAQTGCLQESGLWPWEKERQSFSEEIQYLLNVLAGASERDVVSFEKLVEGQRIDGYGIVLSRVMVKF